MHDLEITWSGGQIRFSPDDSPVLVGRSSSADVVVPQGTVSRRHLVMNWNGRSWGAEDISTHGTFDPIGVRLAATWTVGTDLVIRLGSPRGAELSMRLITRTLDESDVADPFADPESPPTVVDFGPPPRPEPVGDDGLLHVSGSHASTGVESSAPIGLPDNSAGFTPEPVAFEQPTYTDSASAEIGHNDLGHDDRANGDPGNIELGRGQEEQHTAYDDPPSFRPEPVSFQPGPDSNGPTDEPRTTRAMVESGSAVIGAPSADRAAMESAGRYGETYADHHQDNVDPVSVDFTQSEAVIDLDGGQRQPSSPPDEVNGYQWPAPDDRQYHEPIHQTVFDGPVDAAFDDGHRDGLGSPGNDEQIVGPAATFVENDTLRLQIDGEDFVFMPGHEVTVGRDPRCTVTVDERHSLVSRHHLRFVHAEGSWWLEDASSKGTFVDGRRLNRPYRSEGAFIAHLGDPAAGTQLRVVTQGQHRQPTNRAGLAIGAIAAAALVLASLVAWFVFGRGGEDGAALSTAKKSTVMLLSDSGHGSGFFVSESLIVTNQHVAAMADQLVVAVSPEEDEPAQIQFVATLVENHPFLDIAVVEITNRAEFNDQGTVTIGEPVDSADVPILQLGDSSAVTIGDPVTSTGFPGRFSVSSSDDNGQLRLAPVSTTSGQAANFTSWPGCSTPDLSSFIPPDAPPTVTCSASGNIDKGVLLASFPSGEGASGSAVIHGDKVVAVLFAGDAENSTASRSITTNAFSDWLGGVLSTNG